jgi:hypothetical protein
MSFFGVSIAPLPKSVKPTHFSREQLQKLYNIFCTGSGLPDPAKIADLAEQVYAFPL